MIEAAFSNGDNVPVAAFVPMTALTNYIGERQDKYPMLAEVDFFTGVVEADQFEGILDELESINCKGDCPVIQALIGVFQSAMDEGDEWVMFV